MPRENSSIPVCRSVRTVKSTSASKLDVELTVMLEHLRSMPRWVSFKYRISWSWSSSETEPRRLSHGSICRERHRNMKSVKLLRIEHASLFSNKHRYE